MTQDEMDAANDNKWSSEHGDRIHAMIRQTCIELNRMTWKDVVADMIRYSSRYHWLLKRGAELADNTPGPGLTHSTSGLV